MRDVENPMTSINHPFFEDAQVVAYDVFGQEIYVGDKYYDFAGDLVHEDNLEEYFEDELLTAKGDGRW